MSTTPAAGINLYPFIIDIPGSQEPEQWIQGSTSATLLSYAAGIGYKVHIFSNLKNKTDLLQYQDTIHIPNTYTIIDSDVFCDTPNLQPNWIPPCVDEPNLLKGLTYTSSTAIVSLVNSIHVLYN